MTKQRKASRSITFWALIIVFFMPLVLAVLLFVTRSHWQLDSVPEGELLNPPVLFVDIPQMPRLWRVIYLTPSCVGPDCELQLAKITSIHDGTGKNFDRVAAVLITTQTPIDRKLLENFIGVNELNFNAQSDLEPGLYIMDPNGYVILKYASDTPGGIVLHDLRHLLKVSQIG